MSLAKLFYMKETFRESIRRWRQACFRTRNSALAKHDASRFLLEALEPRVLLSATPTEVIATQALEPAAVTVPAGSLPSLDVDLNGQADALSDGIVIIRHLFGFTEDALTEGAIDPTGRRTDPTEIGNYLTSITSALDVELDGQSDALTDGIVILRSLFGFTGQALIDGATSPFGQRPDPAAIATYLDNMNPQRELIAPLVTAGLQQDTGVSATDQITLNPTFTGTIADINQIAAFTAGFDAAPVGNFVDVLTDLQTTGVFMLSATRLAQVAGGTLADGTHTLHLRATDARGNVATIDSTFTLDTITPAGSVTLAASSDTGPVGDRLTTLDVVTLTGQTDPFASIVLTNNGATATADATGLYAFSGLALAEGANQISLSMTDQAGNQGHVVQTITRQGADGSILLKENGAWIVDVSTPIDLATATGTRTFRLTLFPQFDTTDTTAIAEDTFLISLVNPADLSDTLLDRGQNGTALFALHGTTAEFQAGLVTFDGTEVTIDLTSLGAQITGLLRLQLLNHDSDSGSQIRVHTLTSTVNPTGTPPTLFPLSTTLVTRGGAVDLSGYGLTATAHADVGNVRVDQASGRYTAELLLHNIGPAIGRQAVVLFSNLPAGVTLRNPSGVDTNGVPYLNLQPAMPTGGLGSMSMSASILVEFDNPGFVQLPLIAQVKVGPPNQAPVLAPIGPLTVFPGGHLEVPFSATDPDGDRVQFFVTSAAPLPTSMLNGSGTFIITPAPGEEGTYSFNVIASDGALTSSQTVSLTVAPDPTATTRISGKVVGTTGEPLAGVPIEVGRIITLTAADGTFTLDLPAILVPTESFNIVIPTGDVFFDPFNTGTQFISMRRAGSDPATGTSTSNPLQHPNLVTSFLDGNIVYGSDPDRAQALRTLQGGTLKTSAGNLLPFNTTTFFPNGPLENDNGGNANPGSLFVAGDVRASENVALEAMHTILLREHNRLADEIAAANPTFTDEQIFQQARRRLIGELQHIVYSEYLPVLLGTDALPAYIGYNATLDPATSALFATAAFRLGHSQMVSQLLRLDATGAPLASGPLNLRDAFFTTAPITTDGIDPIMRGLLAQQAQEIDSHVVDELRNFLFGPPGSGGMDLVSLNIQRGRDLGLPSYTQARLDFGLSPITSFSQITSDVAAQQMLQSVYGTVDKVDVWVGGIAEDHAAGALIGPLFQKIIADQFARTRNADRFWYENSQFTAAELTEIRSTTFAEIIARNTGLTNLPTNVFTTSTPPTGPAPAGTAATTTPIDFRSPDGSGNHQTEPTLGQTGTNLLANFTRSYGDGISTPGGADRPGAREISNAVFPQTGSIPNTQGATALAVFFGQILSHDLSLTATGITDTMKIHGDQAAPVGTYPFVAEKLPLMLGHDVYAGLNNVIARPIFLPAIDLANADQVSATQDTTIDTAAIPGAMVNVAAGTLLDREGHPFTGLVSITQVPSSLTPASLPPGLNPDLVVTIQPAEMVFSTPAPISFPNTGGYQPGAILDLWSINPLTGQFDLVGKMQVSDDGSIIETIEGGIRNSSWHFPAPDEDPPPPTTSDNKCCGDKATQPTQSEVELYSGGLLESHNLVTYQSQGIERGLTLAYDSLRADPRQIIQIGFNNARSAQDRYLVGRVVIDDGQSSFVVPGGAMPGQTEDGWHFWKIPQFQIPRGFVTPFGSIEAAIEADLSSLPTGLYTYSATYGLQNYRPAETVGQTTFSERFVGTLSTFESQVLSINEIASPFGAGWGMAGFQKVVNSLPSFIQVGTIGESQFEQATGQPVILVDGNGGQLVFRKAGTTSDRSTAPIIRAASEVGPNELALRYASPVGDFSVLELLYRTTQTQSGPSYTLDGFMRTTPEGTVYRYALDGRLTGMTDRNGNVTRYEYDGANRLIKIVDPVGLETLFSYTGDRVTTITDPAGKITQLQYDAAGNLTRITDPDGSQRAWSYDEKHHMVQEIDQRGNVEQEVFDFAGRVVSSVRKDGTLLQVAPFETRALFPSALTSDWHTAPEAKHKADTASVFVAANGNVIRTMLDGAGQATVSFDSLGNLPSVQRDSNNLIIRSTDAAGNPTVFTYDSKGSLLTQRDSLSGGSRVTGSIGQAGEQDSYTFTLKDDTRLYFDSFTNSNAFVWSLTGPTGTVVANRAFAGSDDGGLSSSPIIFAPAGDYTLTVDGVGNATGGYDFRMLDVKNAKSLALGTQVAGALNLGNETVLYQFDATAGEKLYFDWQGNAAFTDASWRLVAPLGNQVFGPTSLSTDVEAVPLNQTGSYTLLIEGSIGNTSPTAYAFTVYRDPANRATLILNETTSGAISQPGQADQYAFNLSQATQLFFDPLTTDGNLVWSLSGPRGIEESERALASGGHVLGALPAGDYTITIEAVGDGTGAYSFHLRDLAGATSVEFDSLVSGQLSNRGAALYKFTAAAGDEILFDQQTHTGANGIPTWRLLTPYGEQLFSQGFSDVATQRLGVGGTYALILDAPVNDPDGVTHNYSFVLSYQGNSPLAPLTQLDSADVYSFFARAGEEVIITTTTPGDGIGDPGNTLNPALQLFDPNGVLIASDLNSAPDGRNAVISTTVPTTGQYKISVLSTSGGGDYTVRVTRADGTAPQVVESTVSAGAIVDQTLSTIRLTFSEPLNPSTVTAQNFQVLGPNGQAVPLTGIQLSNNESVVQLTVDPLALGAHQVVIKAAAVTDQAGNPVGSQDLVTPFAVFAQVVPPMDFFVPVGSQTYAQFIGGQLDASGASTSFTMLLDSGQTLTVGMAPQSPTLRLRIELLDDANIQLSVAEAPFGGVGLGFDAVPIPTTGVYTLRVQSLAGTGSFGGALYLNAVEEIEIFGGPTNDTLATAVDIQPTSVALQGTADRLGVTGYASGGDDFYRVDLTQGQVLEAVVQSLFGKGTMGVDLRNSAGTVVAVGGDLNDFYLGLQGFVAPTTGTYYLNVSGAASDTNGALPQYNLVVTRGATFEEVTFNDTLDQAESIALTGQAVGSVGTRELPQIPLTLPDPADFFSFAATAGEEVIITTTTPGDGIGDPGNTLNPALQLFDPNGVLIASDLNSAPDGRNAVISTTVPTTGQYKISVLSTSGGGDYTVRVTRADGTAPQVVESTVSAGAIVDQTLSTIRLTFSEPLNPSTVTAQNFQVLGPNGQAVPLTGIQLSNNESVVQLTVDPLALGAHQVVIKAAAVTDQAGNPVGSQDLVTPFAVFAQVVPPMDFFVPVGSQTYAQFIGGQLDASGASTSFTMLLDSGQTLTVGMAPQSPTLRLRIELLDDANIQLSVAEAPFGGVGLGFDAVPIPTTGVYTLRVQSLAGTGSFGGALYLNAVEEIEIFGGPTNDTLATAVDIQPTSVALQGTADRLGVTGYASGGDDFYRVDLTQGQVLEAVVQSLFGKGTIGVDLRNSAGTVVAVGGDLNDFYLGLQGFVAPTTGTYYLNVSGAASDTNGALPQYNLVVTRGAIFEEVTFNDTLDQAESIALTGQAVGSVGTRELPQIPLTLPDPADFFSFDATAGEEVIITTTTPGDGIGDPGNTLNPALQLFDPNGVLIASDLNSAPDGRNAVISTTVATTGQYKISVLSTSGGGDYTVRVTRADRLAPQVVESTVSAGAIVDQTLSTIRLTFSEPLNPSTVTAQNFQVLGPNGQAVPLTGIQLSNNESVVQLTVDPLALGAHQVVIKAAAVTDQAGNPVGSQDLVTPFAVSAQIVSPMNPLFPLGSHVYTQSIAGQLDAPGTSKDLVMSLNGGQNVTIRMAPQSPTLWLRAELLDSAGTVLRAADAVESGGGLSLHAVPIPTTGVYTLRVQSLAGTGSFEGARYLNALEEIEIFGGPANDTLATAVDIQPTSVALQGTADRLGVVGYAGGGDDFYRVDLTQGQVLEAVVQSLFGKGTMGVDLRNSAGTVVWVGGDLNDFYLGLQGFVAPTTGTYYLNVSGAASDTNGALPQYNLVVTRGATFEEVTFNDSFATALDISLTGQAMGSAGARIISQTSLTLGATTKGAITAAGELDGFTFSLTEETSLVFDSQTSNSLLGWTLIGPTGTLVFQRSFGSSDSFLGNPWLQLHPGEYRLTIGGLFSESTGSYAFRLLNANTATPLAVGTPVSGTLDPGNETDLYRFAGIAGEQIYLDQQAYSGSGNAFWRLVNPYGQEVAAGSFTDVGPLTLGQTGTYTLLVEGALGNVLPASHTFTVQPVQNDLVVLTVNETTLGAITAAWELDGFTFSLAEETSLVFDSQTSNSLLGWTLVGPTGTLVTQRPFAFSDGVTGITVLQLHPGEYRLTIGGFSGSTGSYAFRLLNANTATPLAVGTPVSGTLDPGNETDLYRFAGIAGEQIYLDQQAYSGSGNAFWRLVNPYGQEVAASPFTDMGPLTLGQTGPYMLLVEGHIGNPLPASYAFTVQPVVQNVESLTLNVRTGGVITGAGEQDRYTFEGAAGQRLYFDSLDLDAAKLNATLIAPGGNSLFALTAGSNPNAGILTLTQTGTYSLVIDGTGDQTGSYAFRLLDTSTARLITPGMTKSGQLAPLSETDLYAFDGTAGTRVTIDSLSSSGGTAAWRLIGPGSQVLANGGLDTDVSATLPATGRYVVAIEGGGTVNGVPLDYQFQLLTSVDAPVSTAGLPLLLFSVISPEGGVVTETRTKTFTATQGLLVYIHSKANLPDQQQTTGIELLDPVGTRIYSGLESVPGGPFVLPRSGQYTLSLISSGTSSYTVRLVDLTAEATALTLGETISGSIGPGNFGAALYRFTGTAGQRLLYDGLHSAFRFNNLTARLVSPSGVTLFTTADQANSAPVTLTETGTHYLLLELPPTSTGELFSFRLLDLAAAAQPLTLGIPTNGSLTTGFATDVYRFNGVAGQRAFFDGLSTHGPNDGSWILYNPFDQPVAGGGSLVQNDFEVVLQNSGSYTLVVAGNRPAAVATPYSFRVTVTTDIPSDVFTPVGDGRATGNGRVFTYDSQFSQLASITDELGRAILFDVNPTNGNTSSITRVVGAVGGDDDVVTHVTYTPHGLVDLVTDPLGRMTDYDYDLLDRLTTITLAKGTVDQGVQQFEYDAAGNVTAFIDENGHRTEFAYDPMNRLILTRDALSHETRFAYDAAGNLIHTTDARANQTAYAYDVFDRRISMTDAIGGITKYAYDVDNNLVSVTDPLNHQTTYAYDLRDRLIATNDAGGGVTRFGYDPNNNLTSLTDPVANTTAFAYDARDRMVVEIDPLGKSTRYQYDTVNNLVGTIDRNGQAMTYAYDELNRLITETWVGGGNVITSQYDKVGNLTSILDQFSKLTFTYDNRDRVKTLDNQGTPNAPRVALSYVYDGAGNILAVNDAINGTAAGTNTYSYDALNRTTRITQSGAGVTDKRVDFTYNEVSQFASVTRYSDLAAGQVVATSNYVYDALNRLTNMTHKNAANTVLNHFDLEYDPASRITKITDIDGATDYNYDVTDQLTGATNADPGNPDETYQYDENGNRVSSSIHGNGYVTGPGNRLLSDGTFDYVYDGKGSLIKRTEIATGKVREFDWDQRGRLVEVDDRSAVDGPSTQTVKFTYDALNRRISKTVDADGAGSVGESSTLFVYDRDDVLLDFLDADGAGGSASPTLTERYLHGPAVDQILAQEDASGNVFWMLTDHLGTVRDLVTNSGVIGNHLIYNSFGTVISETDTTVDSRYLFTGREYDKEADLYYFRARYYDSIVGSFSSEDPVGFGGRDANLYAYVGNDPISYVDPAGTLRIPPNINRRVPDIDSFIKHQENIVKNLQEALDLYKANRKIYERITICLDMMTHDPKTPPYMDPESLNDMADRMLDEEIEDLQQQLWAAERELQRLYAAKRSYGPSTSDPNNFLP